MPTFPILIIRAFDQRIEQLGPVDANRRRCGSRTAVVAAHAIRNASSTGWYPATRRAYRFLYMEMD